MWNNLDGRIVRIDGLSWKLRVATYDAIYPYPHVVTNVTLEPTPATKRSKQYIAIKRDLGDDWSTDVLASEPEFQVKVLQLAGVQLCDL